MPTLDTTIGGSTANAFVSITEADTYLDARLNADAWNTEPDDDQKARAIIEATRQLSVLDGRLQWDGYVNDSTQALQWPRRFCRNPDSAFLFYFPGDQIPQRVKNATCELALEFLKAGTTDIAELDPLIGITREKVDTLETQYAEPWQRARGLERFPSVMRFIRPLLAANVSGQQIPLVRG